MVFFAMKSINFAVIGYGQRGKQMTESVLSEIEDINIVAVCDNYADRADEAADYVEKKIGKRPFSTTDYVQALKFKDVEAVFVATDWETHVEVAIDALKEGLPVALEVGGAYTIESLWNLVHTQESTGTPLMFMENCCFGKEEILVTSMARHGVFGDIVHCHGAYGHYLASEIAEGDARRHYRLRNYLKRNGENYPTHELGPIAKLLNINRGNRMVSLVSVASRAAGMEDYIRLHEDKHADLIGKRFSQGDIINTIITCADGSTISLKLDTTLPRSYSRELTICGTRGRYEMNTNTVYFDSEKEYYDPVEFYRNNFDNLQNFVEKYQHPIWKSITPEEQLVGHGGMDGIEFRVFVDCLRDNKPMPIDVYDAAAWMCITTLSEASIALGGTPQIIPDFTSGAWTYRQPLDVLKLL